MRNNGASVPSLTWFIPAAAALYIVWLLSPILSPFLFAIILAYIFDPWVDRMQIKRIPRSVGAIFVLLFLISLFVILVLILVPMIERETRLLLERMPVYLDWFKLKVAPWLQMHFGIEAVPDADKIKALISQHLKNAGDFAVLLLPSIKTSGLALIGIVTNLLLIPVVFFYVLRDWDDMMKSVENLLPRRWHAKILEIARDIDQVLAEFLRGQIAVILLMTLFYVIALYLAGLEFALPVGLVTGLLVFIPYLGMAIGLTLALLASLMQLHGLGGLLPVLTVFAVGQVLESMVVTPFLVGERIGLHPVAVIFALLAFGQLFGFFGILLALPASAALLVGLRHLQTNYLNSTFYKQ